MLIKPPLGVSPHWFVYHKRMTELCDTIARYLAFIGDNQHIINHAQYYQAIAMWSKELEQLALLEAEIRNMEKNHEKQ